MELTIPEPPSRGAYTVLGWDEKYHKVTFRELQDWAKRGRITGGHQVYSHSDKRWFLAEEVPGIRSVFYKDHAMGKYAPVKVAAVSIPFVELAWFVFKCSLAALPAIFIITLFFLLWTGVLS